MYGSINRIISISLIICIVSASVFFLLSMSAASANASSSVVHFSTTGGMSSAGDGPQQITIVREGDTSNETIKVIVEVLNSSLTDSEYQYSPTVFSWDAGDNSSRNLTVTVPATIKNDVRQTITFGLIKVEGSGDVADPTRYEMAIDFPIDEPAATPTQVPTPTLAPSSAATATLAIATITNGSPQVQQNNTMNNSTAVVSPTGTNNSMEVVSNAQDMPIVMFGGLVSLGVLIAAGYLLLFKRK